MVEERWGNTRLTEGFHFDDCKPVHVKSFEHDVQFKNAILESLTGKTIWLYLIV